MAQGPEHPHGAPFVKAWQSLARTLHHTKVHQLPRVLIGATNHYASGHHLLSLSPGPRC
jgi:hypothetical protein